MSRRVVITGLGVLAPNGNHLANFEMALRKGQSGVRANPDMEESNFACRVAGVPQGVDEIAASYFAEDELMAMNAGHRYASIVTIDAWLDAGLTRPERDDDRVDWDSGAVVGTGVGGIDTIGTKLVPFIDAGKVRRLGSTVVEQVMASGVSARVCGFLALGNQVTTNSSACSTGTEAIAMGYERIRRGLALRMLCGGVESPSRYIWGGFDAMRVLCRRFNDEPEKASRPMSASAGGFVPGAGAGALLLEDLETARERGARIYAEVLGTAINCEGHRSGGSMTAPNPQGVQRCIRAALDDAQIGGNEVDLINGHLTATGADPSEVAAWSAALERGPQSFPVITSTKSMIGHTLGAAGAVESVATILMLTGSFVHPSINCEDVHPEIEPFAGSIPHSSRQMPELRTAMKSGFGFGDVNACAVFRKWDE